MDREDWLYMAGAVLASAGCGLMVPAWGLVCLGAFAVFPPVVALLRNRGPQR